MTNTLCPVSISIAITLLYLFSYPLAAETFTIEVSDEISNENINLIGLRLLF